MKRSLEPPKEAGWYWVEITSKSSMKSVEVVEVENDAYGGFCFYRVGDEIPRKFNEYQRIVWLGKIPEPSPPLRDL